MADTAATTAPDSGAQENGSFLAKWGALIALCLTMFIVVLDSTMMNVAIPRITQDLNTTVGAVQAVVASYSMIMASLMLAGAKLGTIVGARSVFRIALVIYGVGTALATVSWNIETLFLGWSVIEGIAAAALIPLSMALVAFNYQGKERALAFGILGGFQATAAAVGPVVGGFLTTFLTWRLGFALEVVIVIVVLAMLRFLAGAKGDRSQSFDIVGTVLSVLALGSIVVGSLLAGRHGWIVARRPLAIGDLEIAPLGLSVTFWLLLFGLAMFVAFGHWQLRREKAGKTPLLRLRVLKNGTFLAGFTTDAFQSVTLAGLLFVAPLFLQNVLGLDAMGAGLALLPLSASVLLVSITTPGLGARISPKLLTLAGAATMGVGIVWLAETISVGMDALDMTLPLVLFGAGTGLLLGQVPNLTLSSVEPDLNEEASGVQNAAKEAGSALGVAVIGSVLAVVTFGSVVTSVLQTQDITVTDEQRDRIVVAFEDELDALTPNERREAARELDGLTGGRIDAIVAEASVEGMRNALYTVGVFVLLALLTATFLPRARLEDRDHPADEDAERIPRRAVTPERGV